MKILLVLSLCLFVSQDVCADCLSSSGDTLQNGFKMEYFDNGTVRRKTHYESGKRNGPDSVFYKSGIIKEVLNYYSDYLHRYYLAFYENGNLKVKGFFQYPNGNPDSFSKVDDRWIYYYENGKKKMEGKFSEHQFLKSDEYKEIDYEYGTLVTYVAKHQYIAPIGRWDFYNERGEFIYSKVYAEGCLAYFCLVDWSTVPSL